MQQVGDALIKTTLYLLKTLTDKGPINVAACWNMRVWFATGFSAESLWKDYTFVRGPFFDRERPFAKI